MSNIINKAGANGSEYTGRLGAFITPDGTTVRLWAPEAVTVAVNFYVAGEGGASETHDMYDADGVWEYSCKSNLCGVYYTVTVDGVETTDPYAHTAGINGERGMILDFASPRATPDGWSEEHDEYKAHCPLRSYTDAVIWETHVRDFSFSATASHHRGKYLAFTERLKNESGRVIGVDYLRSLGITHVHLLPVAEYATVDQRRLGEPDYNAFNWGYDPYSHNIPSGVYSENPYDGYARVYELRRCVAALHAAGIGVVLDVVYNHTFDFNCPLGRVYKPYYYRRDSHGDYTDGSGCGNELATEKPMCRKYILDSLSHWAREYHLDGFRFDLMGVIDIETMRQAEKLLHGINPNMLIYGEGWLGGPSALAEQLRSTKYNVLRPLPDGLPRVAVFSDTARDGIKGSVFDGSGGYVNGRSYETVGAVRLAVTGCTAEGRARSAAECINYVSAHDNNTLWDKIHITCPHLPIDERIEINKLAATVYLTAQGIPFMQGGEEMLRSKPLPHGYDGNSYRSPDEVNAIRWRRLRIGSAALEVSDYYKALIAIRKAHPALRLSDATEIADAVKFIAVTDRYDVVAFTVTARGESLFIAYNPLGDVLLKLPDGEWGVCVLGGSARLFPCDTVFGEITVPARSAAVLVRL